MNGPSSARASDGAIFCAVFFFWNPEGKRERVHWNTALLIAQGAPSIFGLDRMERPQFDVMVVMDVSGSMRGQPNQDACERKRNGNLYGHFVG